MVIISGAVFGISSLNKNLDYYTYLKTRIPRLLAPTWTFLIFYFVFLFVIYLIKGKDFPFSPTIILESFALIDGIGYVWIIRVFILAAIIGPLFSNLHKRINNDFKYYLILLSIYILYEISYFYYNNINIQIVDFIINNYIFYIIPYGLLFGFGLHLPTLKPKVLYSILLLFIVIFVILLNLYFLENFSATNLYKYPPRIYYLSYAISISLFLFSLTNFNFINVLSNNLITFISSSSLWIYLWHILFISSWKLFVSFFPLWVNNFIIEFFVVFLLSIIITYIQKSMINYFIIQSKIGTKWSKILSLIFLK